MRNNTERYYAGIKARREKRARRPTYGIDGQTHRGLLPEEIEAWYVQVNAIREKHEAKMRADTLLCLSRLRKTG